MQCKQEAQARTRYKTLILVCALLLLAPLSLKANTLEINTAFLPLEATLEEALALDPSRFKPHKAIMINPFQGYASAWIKLKLPTPEQRLYRLTMPFSLRTSLNLYAYRRDGTISAYSLGAHGADTKYHASALGHQVQLDSELLDFNRPIYIQAKASLFLNQAFDYLSEAEFQSLEQQITSLHKGMVAICLLAIFAYCILLLRYPTALVGASLVLLIGLLFFILSSISLNLVTSINFQSPALHVVALFDMPLMFFLVAMCMRRLGLVSFISPIIDKGLLTAQAISLSAAALTLVLDSDTADNIAFFSVVINLAISAICVLALLISRYQYKCARYASIIFGTPSLGTLIYMAPAYFGLMPATSGYMALPITTIGMIVGLLILVPQIDSGQLHRENQAVIDSIDVERPFMPLAMRYSIIVLSFSLTFIAAATVIISALHSRQTEQQYTHSTELQFARLKDDFESVLLNRSVDTRALEDAIDSGRFSALQLSAEGRDGTVLYNKTSSEAQRAHTSYFQVMAEGKVGIAKLTLDITKATEHEAQEHNGRLILNLALATAVAVFSLSIFRILVTNHLESVAEHLKSIHFKGENSPLSLTRDSEIHSDELDFLASAIVQMETDLHHNYSKLSESKAYLEKEIIKRTAAYKEVLEREHRKRHLVTMGLMVAGVAHEIRNPLGTLANSTQFLREKSAGHFLPVLDRMDRSIHRCNRVVEELHTIGQLNTLRLKGTDIRAWLLKLLEDYSSLYSIPITPLIDQDVRATIDRYRLEQVIVILLDNARQAIQPNAEKWPIDGRIESSLSLAEPGTACIKIIDNGMGIPSNLKPRIFEPLSSSKTHGLGMGLTIALDIVEQHGGSLTLHDRPRGVVAEIRIPADLGKLSLSDISHDTKRS
ncbi:MAG: ATP-binding protein [Granulosicoccaceae bacterium]